MSGRVEEKSVMDKMERIRVGGKDDRKVRIKDGSRRALSSRKIDSALGKRRLRINQF